MSMIFGTDKLRPDRTLNIWGPTASVSVKIDALSSVVKEEDGPWLLEGMTINAQEIVDVRQCFNDVAYIYALGNDQGRCLIALSFLVFCGGKECSSTAQFQALKEGLSDYAKNRISEHPETSSITIGSFSAQGWLIGVEIGNLDATTGICHAGVKFMLKLEGA